MNFPDLFNVNFTGRYRTLWKGVQAQRFLGHDQRRQNQQTGLNLGPASLRHGLAGKSPQQKRRFELEHHRTKWRIFHCYVWLCKGKRWCPLAIFVFGSHVWLFHHQHLSAIAWSIPILVMGYVEFQCVLSLYLPQNLISSWFVHFTIDSLMAKDSSTNASNQGWPGKGTSTPRGNSYVWCELPSTNPADSADLFIASLGTNIICLHSPTVHTNGHLTPCFLYFYHLYLSL